MDDPGMGMIPELDQRGQYDNGLDYDPDLLETITLEEQERLKELSFSIKNAERQHVLACLEIGELIQEAHEMLASTGRMGRFAHWIEEECQFSKSTAYTYLWIWQRFRKIRKYALLFEMGALRLLCPPRVVDSVVSEAILMAERGEKVTYTIAKSLIAKEVVRKSTSGLEDDLRKRIKQRWKDELAAQKAGIPEPPAVDPKFTEECLKVETLPPVDPPAADEDREADKLFSGCFDHIKRTVGLLDRLGSLTGHETYREKIQNQLQVAYDDLKRWRRHVIR